MNIQKLLQTYLSTRNDLAPSSNFKFQIDWGCQGFTGRYPSTFLDKLNPIHKNGTVKEPVQIYKNFAYGKLDVIE